MNTKVTNARKTMGEQVAEQAVLIETLRAELSEIKADFRILESAHEVQSATCIERGEQIFRQADTINDLQQALKDSKARETKLEADCKSKDSSYTYANKRAEAAETEIAQAHASLDAIPEAIAKEFEQEYGKGVRTLSVRLIGTILAVVRASK